jgi:hypothetical protein
VTRHYRLDLPKAEGMRLAGIGLGWPATPEGRCIHAISTWLTGLERRNTRAVLITKISHDLWPLLEAVPQQQPPLRGPFAPPGHGGSPLPGHVQYLGAGTVRLDSAALSALAELSPGEDFRILLTATGPAMVIGTASYPAREEASPAP